MFAPSEFEFVPNSVRFCCPHCQQTYFGTGAKGHLVPRTFDCVKCGAAIDMDRMVLLPAEGVAEARTKPDANPWLERKERGFFKALFATVGKSLAGQAAMMRGLGDQVRPAEAWRFALLILLVWLGVGVALPFFGFAVFTSLGSASRATVALGAAAGTTLGLATVWLTLILLWGLSTHGLLRITGGAEHTIGRTFEAILYSSGVTFPLAVPLLGVLWGSTFVTIWWIVSAVLMIVYGQKVHGGRATLATLAFPGTMFILVGGGYFGFIAYVLGQAGPMGPGTSWSTGLSSVQTLTRDVMDYAQINDGSGPPHVILLLQSDAGPNAPAVRTWNTSADDFVEYSTDTYTEDIPVDNATLDEFENLTATERRVAVANVLDAMPKNLVAYRFGDYVFTYPGADLSAPDNLLWVVVMLPDPDVNRPLAPWQSIEVGLADKSVTIFQVANLAMQTESQNVYRASIGLPPLPDLTTVTHDAPAVAKQIESED
ncbi:MAG: YIP1 family protein [Planctomycetes bacterium]|nr:YIP1 family protein [Planctomycetota bacterium]